jgi:hypothetical protein
MNETLELPVDGGERKWKVVYTIVEKHGQPEKKFWVRVGSAFVNRDQSLNVRLDAMPTNGTLHIRDYDPDGRDARGELRPRREASVPYRANEGGLR